MYKLLIKYLLITKDFLVHFFVLAFLKITIYIQT